MIFRQIMVVFLDNCYLYLYVDMLFYLKEDKLNQVTVRGEEVSLRTIVMEDLPGKK